MNNYQIYEEVGRGRNSTVYKGRRKRSIDYYAVASIDKSQRQRVLNSVHFLRSMSHENVLKFTNWYETTNHLWVITEYCTGGSLKALLELDRGLPERCTRTFGFDVVKALAYVHSRGVLYADLKPSNILIDDCAVLRLYDFGLAQSVETAAKGLRVGTPSYMAPELFLEGGVHSFASDLWALGCVLFELATGKPPFVDSKLQTLIGRIVNDPTPKADAYSSSFQELIDGLLHKDPLQRISWADVFGSEFWAGAAPAKAAPPALPIQPAFEAYRLTREEADARLASERERQEKKSRDVLRASVNAERNLAREVKDRGGYGAAAPTALGVDREVDFSDPAEAENAAGDGAGGSDSRPSSSQAAARGGGGDALTQNPSLTSSGQGSGERQAQAGHQSAVPQSQTSPPQHPHPPQSASDAQVERPPPRRPQSGGAGKAGGAEPVVRASLRLAPTGAKLPETADPGSVAQLLTHASDGQVKSIIMNSRIERIVEPRFEAQELPFPAKTTTQLRAMDTKELEGFLHNVYHALSGAMSAADKLNTLCYFATLCTDTHMANVFINSSVGALCVKLLSLPSTPANMCQLLATTLGMLLRNATLILADLQKTGILPALAAASDPSQAIKVRRRALGCLGELLFYISTQSPADVALWKVPADAPDAIVAALSDDDEILRHYAAKTVENIAAAGQNNHSEGAPISRYANAQVVSGLIDIFKAPVAAVKSEHLRASALHTALRLSLYDSSLLPQVTAGLPPSTLYPEILSANSSKAAQALLSYLNSVLARLIGTLVHDKSCSDQHLAKTVQWLPADASSEANAKDARAFAVASGSTLSNFRTVINDATVDTPRLVHGIACALESTTAAVRGKGVLAAVMLTVVAEPFLGVSCESRLMSYAEKLAFDRDEYVRQCARIWHRLLQRYVLGTVRQLPAITAGSAAGLTEELRIVLHVVTPPTLKNFILGDGELFTAAGAALVPLGAEDAAEAIGPDGAEYQKAFFLFVEALTQDKSAVLQHHAKVTNHFLPGLVPLLKAADGAVRFSAIRMIHDVISLLVNKPHVYNPATPQAGSVGTINSVGTAVLPFLTALLTDGDPIPLYAIKVITALGDRSPTFMGKVANRDITEILTRFVKFGQANATVYSVRALLRVLQCGDESLMELSVAEGLVPRITEIVRAAIRQPTEGDGGGNLDEFLDPCLEVVLFALCAAQRDTNGPVAVACNEWAQSVTSLFLPICATRHSCSECAATCAGMLVSQYSVAANAIVSKEACASLRECFTAVDEPASHVALELAKALCAALSIPGVDVSAMLRDEVLLVSLEEASDYTHALNEECSIEIRRLLTALHKRRD